MYAQTLVFTGSFFSIPNYFVVPLWNISPLSKISQLLHPVPSMKKCLHPQLFPIRLLPILLIDFSTMTHRIRGWIHLERALSCWCPLPLNTPSAFSRWWLKNLPSNKSFGPSPKSQTNESACLLILAAKSPFPYWSRDADKKGLDFVTCTKNSDRQERKKKNQSPVIFNRQRRTPK